MRDPLVTASATGQQMAKRQRKQVFQKAVKKKKSFVPCEPLYRAPNSVPTYLILRIKRLFS